MSSYKFLKKVKNFSLRFKFLSLSVLITAVAIPIMVFASPTPNTPEGGYKSIKHSSNLIIFHYSSDHAVYPTGNCVQNISSNDYFIPTANWADWTAFFNNRPVLLYTCVGDKICDSTANENCYNDPLDCGTCAYPCNYDGVCTQDEDNGTGFCSDCDQQGGSTGNGCNTGPVQNGSINPDCSISCFNGYCLGNNAGIQTCTYCGGGGGGGDGCGGNCGEGCLYYCGCPYPNAC